MRATLRNESASDAALAEDAFTFEWTVAHARPGAMPVEKRRDPGVGMPTAPSVAAHAEVSADFPLSGFCDPGAGCPSGSWRIAATDRTGRTATVEFELRPDVAPAPPGAVRMRIDDPAIDDAGCFTFEAIFENVSGAPVWVPATDALRLSVTVTWNGGMAGSATARGSSRALSDEDGEMVPAGATVTRSLRSAPLDLPHKKKEVAFQVSVSPDGSYYPAFSQGHRLFLSEPVAGDGELRR